jgi:hypothetical protein
MNVNRKIKIGNFFMIQNFLINFVFDGPNDKPKLAPRPIPKDLYSLLKDPFFVPYP